MALGDLGKKVDQALTGTIKGAGDVVGATTDVVRKSLVEPLKVARDVTKEATGLVTDAVTGVIQAANQSGTELGSAVKGG